MITEVAVERVEFTCGNCWHRWSADYDVQHYRDENGADWEYFSRDGMPVASPYSAEGAQACPRCHRHWVGHLAARRQIPLPPGEAGTPRAGIGDRSAYRIDRHTAPLLVATSHHQPSEHDPATPQHAHADH